MIILTMHNHDDVDIGGFFIEQVSKQQNAD